MEHGWRDQGFETAVSHEAIATACSQVIPDATLVEAKRLRGGLVNVNTRVTLETGGESTNYVLRGFVRDGQAAAKEATLLARMATHIPVANVHGHTTLDVGTARGHRAVPALLLSFVKGKRLADLISMFAPKVQARAGRQLGTIAASIHAHTNSEMGMLDAEGNVTHPMPGVVNAWQHEFDARISDPQCSERLTEPLARALRVTMADEVPRLREIDGSYSLLHADFKPTNVLVNDDGHVQALLDWEFAWSGPPLFDIGQMLRYETPETFQDALITSYVTGGGQLSPNWRRYSQTLDALNLIQFLTRPSLSTQQVRDIRALLTAFVHSRA